MELQKAILTRRSIRKYQKKEIKNEYIKDFLEAGMNAPSAGNEQPWHFIVINKPEILKEVPTFHNHAQMLSDAASAILVCGDKKLFKHDQMWIQDCAAATQNILLSIHSKNLGAVWLGIYPREQRMKGMKELLEIPDEIIPFSLISIGYPAEEKTHINRYNQKRIHYNKW